MSAPTTPTSGRRKRIISLIAAIAVAATGSAVGAVLLLREPAKPEPPPDLPQLNEIGASVSEAGCRDPERPEYQGLKPIKHGEKHPAYSSNPPSSGWYLDDIQPGYYEQVLPDENVLAIAARGGIVVWTSEADSTNARIFYNRAHRNDMIVLKDPDRVKKGVVFVAWGFVVRCEKFSSQMALLFLERYSRGKALIHLEPTAKSAY